MPDIRSSNGKLIYQLASAASLNGNELFAISDDKFLTRNVSLNQIKEFVKFDYSTEYIEQRFGQIGKLIEAHTSDIQANTNDIIANKDELNKKIDKIPGDIDAAIKKLDGELKAYIDEKNSELGSEDSSLFERINKVEKDLNAKIDSLYTFGTDIPTTLEHGKLYFQYF